MCYACNITAGPMRSKGARACVREASRALRSSAWWRLREAVPSISSAMRCASATLMPALALSSLVVYRFSSHVLCTCQDHQSAFRHTHRQQAIFPSS